mgnify:FL=1
MIYTQIQLFCIFFLTGGIIGLLFDFFRILRKTIKTSDFITYLQDIIFWILSSIIIMYNIFTFNNGEIRLYLFLAILLGSLIYLLLVSKIIIKINLTCIKFFENILRKIILILKIPFSILFKPIEFIIINTKHILAIFINKIEKILKKSIKSQKMLKNRRINKKYVE